MLLEFIACCFLAALAGALFRPGEWYERLAKPSWRQPNRLFGPVSTPIDVAEQSQFRSNTTAAVQSYAAIPDMRLIRSKKCSTRYSAASVDSWSPR